jgi:hypothetical protein
MNRGRFGGKCYSGVALISMWEKDHLEQMPDHEIRKKYGTSDYWFVNTPNYAPPIGYYAPQERDLQGRGYNFPEDRPDIFYVQLPKAKPKSTTDRSTTFPNPGSIIELVGGRRFLVINIDIPQKRTNTATVFIQPV